MEFELIYVSPTGKGPVQQSDASDILNAYHAVQREEMGIADLRNLRTGQAEETAGRAVVGDRRTEGDRRKKMVTPAARRQALEILKNRGLSERAACRFAGVSRRVANYELKQPAKDQALGVQLIEA